MSETETRSEPEHRRVWMVPTRRNVFGEYADEIEVDDEIAAAQWDARCWRERP